jgi:hypothetical protein
LEIPRIFNIFDGLKTVADKIIYIIFLDLKIGGHTSRYTPIYVTSLAQQPVVIGLPWLRFYKTDIRLSNNILVFDSAYCHRYYIAVIIVVNCRPQASRLSAVLNIRIIGVIPTLRLSRRKNHQLLIFIIKNIKIILAPPKPPDLSRLPQKYQEFVDLFLKKLSDKLPPRRLYNYKIILVEGAKPPFGPLYRILRDKLLVLKKYLEKNLFKEFIRSSKSLAVFPVIFIKKPSRGLRLYIDYRNLNKIIIKNRYPIPLVRKILNRIIYTRFFTKLDVITVFNKMRIAEEDK